MLCTNCNHVNDTDAVFCDECGKPLGVGPAAAPARSRKAYGFIVVLIPALLLVGWFGYYKFFLPDGIAAVVNGEDIKLSELDAEIVRTQTAPESVNGRLRYQVLNQMIAERLALQEAVKAKVSVSRDEIAAAVSSARAASGLDEKAFEKEVQSQYGSASAFERALERDLVIKKFIGEKIVPAGADPMTARAAVSTWLQEVQGRSTVRIALAENGSTSGCGSKAGCGGGCNMAGGQQQQKQPASTGPRCRTSGPAASSAGQPKDQSNAAEAACLKYWHDKHGADTVTTKLTDYGCHMQVDIIKNNKSIASLRYQNGNITEL
jgi:hypothetical protein